MAKTPKLSDFCRRVVNRWLYVRRKWMRLADDLECCDVMDSPGLPPIVYRKAADELLQWVRLVRTGSKETLPPAPYIAEIRASGDMEFAFKLAEFKRSQE